MAAYTNASNIALYLGVALTADQEMQAELAAAAASDWIDLYKAQSWQAVSPVTDEIQTVMGDTVWLRYRPVDTVTSVETRAPAVGSDWTALSEGQYELADAAQGRLTLAGWGNYQARVSYSHTANVPRNIAFAATVIAASLLGPTLRPNTSGLESISVGQNDVAVKFSVDYGSVPSEALALLGARGVVIA